MLALAQEPSESRYVQTYQQQTYGVTLPVAPSLVEPGGSVTYYSPNIVSPETQTTSSFFPIIDSLLKVGGSIAGQFFQLQAMKTQAKAQTQAAAMLGPTQRAGMTLPFYTPSTTPSIAGIPITTLLLIGGAGVGAILLLRGRGGRR